MTDRPHPSHSRDPNQVVDLDEGLQTRQLKESSDYCGRGKRSSLTELAADAAEKFSSGFHGLENTESAGLRQDAQDVIIYLFRDELKISLLIEVFDLTGFKAQNVMSPNYLPVIKI